MVIIKLFYCTSNAKFIFRDYKIALNCYLNNFSYENAKIQLIEGIDFIFKISNENNLTFSMKEYRNKFPKEVSKHSSLPVFI